MLNLCVAFNRFVKAVAHRRSKNEVKSWLEKYMQMISNNALKSNGFMQMPLKAISRISCFGFKDILIKAVKDASPMLVETEQKYHTRNSHSSRVLKNLSTSVPQGDGQSKPESFLCDVPPSLS